MQKARREVIVAVFVLGVSTALTVLSFDYLGSHIAALAAFTAGTVTALILSSVSAVTAVRLLHRSAAERTVAGYAVCAGSAVLALICLALLHQKFVVAPLSTA